MKSGTNAVAPTGARSFSWWKSTPSARKIFATSRCTSFSDLGARSNAGRSERSIASWISLQGFGTRFGEAAALTWEDLALSGPSPRVRVRSALSRRSPGPTKTGRIREVPLTRDVIAALDGLPRRGTYVFARESGSLLCPASTNKYIKRFCRLAGIKPVSWHALRHTFATELTARGAPLRAVQELLGHTTIMMTARYAHVAPSTLRATVQLLEDREHSPTWSLFGHRHVSNSETPMGVGVSFR